MGISPSDRISGFLANQDRDADWDEFSNVQFIEVGEFTGDSAVDIVIFQRNNPFKTNDDGSPAGEPGNVTIIENGGCNEKTWSIGARFTHFWAWDLEVSEPESGRHRRCYGSRPSSRYYYPESCYLSGPISGNTQD